VRRFVPFALVLFLCFLCAASGGAATTPLAPRLVVSSGSGTMRIGVFDADASAAVTLHLPAANALAAPAPGTRLGPASAVDAAGPLTGELVAAEPGSGGCGAVPVQAWSLHLSGGGRTVDVPVYVTAERTLVLCLTSAPLRSASFASSAVGVAPGKHRWSSDWTPAAGGAALTAQAVDPGPLRLTTQVRRLRVASGRRVATYVRVSSRVPAAAAVLTTRANGRRVGAARASFLLARLPRATVTVSAVVNGGVRRAGLVFRDLGPAGCVPAGPGCVGATLGGADLSARAVVEAYRR
jgi:hypothetical protein